MDVADATSGNAADQVTSQASAMLLRDALKLERQQSSELLNVLPQPAPSLQPGVGDSVDTYA